MTGSGFPKILSGNGDSPATVVLFERCDVKTRKLAERRFICRRFGVEGIDWTSGIHITTSPIAFPASNALSDLFKKAYEKYNNSPKEIKDPPKDAQTDERDRLNSESQGIFSQWNIDLSNGTSKRIYFDTSNTVYDD